MAAWLASMAPGVVGARDLVARRAALVVRRTCLIARRTSQLASKASAIVVRTDPLVADASWQDRNSRAFVPSAALEPLPSLPATDIQRRPTSVEVAA